MTGAVESEGTYPIKEEPAEEEPAEEPAEEEPAEEEEAPVEDEEAEEAEEEEAEEEDEEAEEEDEEEETEEEEEEEEEEYESLVTGISKAGAPVRTEPDGLSPIIVSLDEATVLGVIGQADDWYAVVLAEKIFDYKVGYIYKDDITLDITPEEPEEPAEGEETETPKKVTIFTSRRVVMEEGETVTLTSKLEGFEGLELMYVWKVNKGEGFEEVEGANEATYSFEASAETLSWGWKLTVLYR